MTIRIEADVSIDQNDPERFTVTEHTRRGFSVLFRGTREDCHDYARSLADDLRTFAREATS